MVSPCVSEKRHGTVAKAFHQSRKGASLQGLPVVVVAASLNQSRYIVAFKPGVQLLTVLVGYTSNLLGGDGGRSSFSLSFNQDEE